MESEPLLSEGFGERLVRWLPKTTHVVQCIVGYPNLDYLTPQLSDTSIIQTQNFTSHMHTYKSHMGRGDCKILQNGIFQLSNQHGVLKIY